MCLFASLLCLQTATVPVSPQAAEPASPTTLDAVQVTATRLPEPVFVVPGSISVRAIGDAADRPGVNVSEILHGIPGILARERQNQAQDLQISIRGFGARSTFGIRGVRLYLDGIPATLPDGQGQVSNFNLMSAARIEVLRGPYSALYGNASGGVIQLFTADGADDPGLHVSTAAGSDGLLRGDIALRGVDGALDYHLSLGRSQTQGYREHSAAGRNLFNAKLAFAAPSGTRITVLANALDQPEAEDPLGLTLEQAQADPRQVVPAAFAFDTRKSVLQRQAGLVLEQPVGGAQSLRVLGYAGRRDVLQFLAVPVAAQANPLSGGGVVDLHSRYSGVDARWSLGAELAGRPLDLVAGLAFDQQDQHRRGRENFRGSELGVEGALRRDQDDRVSNSDRYVQASWQLSDAVGLRAGLRRSSVRFVSADHYVTPGNPDDSGRREFSATSPVLSLSYQPDESLFLYASSGRGFETPTFDELGYRPDGSAGLNFELDAVRTRSLEVGAKGRHGKFLQWQAALFRADSDEELAVVANSGGRSSYANVGPSRRQGVELAMQWMAGEHWRNEFAYTLLDARSREAFAVCAGGPCATPTIPVPAGTPLPGTARQVLAASSRWTSGNGWDAGIEVELVSSVAANSTGTLRAPGYAVLDLSTGYVWQPGRRAFLRLGNIFDRRYIGSVIVNEANWRGFEPAPGRNVLVGLDWRF